MITISWCLLAISLLTGFTFMFLLAWIRRSERKEIVEMLAGIQAIGLQVYIAEGSGGMVTKKHIEFARVVVALAREHKMNHLDMTFDASSSTNDDPHWEKVRMTWREGRHGDTNEIRLETKAELTIEETEKKDSVSMEIKDE